MTYHIRKFNSKTGTVSGLRLTRGGMSDIEAGDEADFLFTSGITDDGKYGFAVVRDDSDPKTVDDRTSDGIPAVLYTVREITRRP